MNIKRLLAIGFIFLIACGGWVFLGSTVLIRTQQSTGTLLGKVKNICGEELAQTAPQFFVKGSKEKTRLVPAANNIDVNLKLQQRRKGLLWFPVYECEFTGTYEIANDSLEAKKVNAHFDFPGTQATFDNFILKVNEKQIDCIINQQKGIDTEFRLNPAETKKITIYYKTRGTGKWIYKPESSGFGRIKNFTMKVRTDFEAIDFPEDSLSPHEKQVSANGCQLLWKADNLITSRPVAIVMPEKLNPGPLVSKVTFFAPVCLLFFFIVMMSITVIAKINIHPMHYLFISAGFFAFNLLFAYLVDVINVHLAFIISTVVTLILVNSYLRTALGAKYPWKWGAAAQFCYLILFSYSFFFKGLTGLTVTIGSIITLAVLMYLTVRIDWTDIFKSSRQRKNEKSNYYSEEKSLNA